MKVLHIIIGPETGGAKNMLFKLVNNSLEINHFIVSLTYGFKKIFIISIFT